MLLLGGLTGLALLATALVVTVQCIRADRADREASARFADARGISRYLLLT